ncbi:hypothetical protein A9320_20600 [Ruegeria sp. PBVC088]|nr:hypothetical protein A9320_20600 [Ruegeria sp. PBVC088]
MGRCFRQFQHRSRCLGAQIEHVFEFPTQCIGIGDQIRQFHRFSLINFERGIQSTVVAIPSRCIKTLRIPKDFRKVPMNPNTAGKRVWRSDEEIMIGIVEAIIGDRLERGDPLTLTQLQHAAAQPVEFRENFPVLAVQKFSKSILVRIGRCVLCQFGRS